MTYLLQARSHRLLGALLLVALLLSLAPGVQAAAPIYVRTGGDDALCDGTVNVDYASGIAPACAVKTIQKGIDLVDAGGTVYVNAGTYDEQVVVSKALTLEGAGATTIIKPTQATAGSFSLFDRKNGGAANTTGVLVTNTTSSVTVSDIQIDGSLVTSTPSAATFMGILYRGTPGVIDSVTVSGISLTNGNGIYVSGYGSAVAVTISSCIVSGYEKNGITANNQGLTATISGNTVTGMGATSGTAQNGIQIGWAATGMVTGNTVANHVWTNTYGGSNDPVADVEADGAAGILLYQPAYGVEIEENILTTNQFAIWSVAAPDVDVHDNTINGLSHTGNAYPTAIAIWSADMWTVDLGGTETATSATVNDNSIATHDYGLLVRDYTPGGSAPSVSVAGNSFATNATQAVATANSAFDTSAILLGNSFDRAVTVEHLSTPLPAIWGKIQLAVNAGTNDDTIKIGAGTYVETVTLTSSTIQLDFVGEVDGNGAPLPTIQGWLKIDLPGADDGWKIENINFLATASTTHTLWLKNVHGVTISNCTFDGAGKFITVPSTDASNGIQLDSGPNGNSYITVQDCVFRNGLYCSIGGYADHFTVRDSTFGNVKSGINLQGGGGNLIVENSEFGVVAQAAGSDTYAVRFASSSGPTPNMSLRESSFVVDKNGLVADAGTYHGALVIRAGASGVLEATNLSIQGEVVNQSTTNLDASGNWWGSAGPATVRAMITGGVSLVDYTPWLATGTDTDGGAVGFTGDFSELWVDDDSLQTGTADRIEEGIDLVNASTVHVAAGTYNESITIDKSLRLLGAQADTAVSSGRTAGDASEATIQGLVTVAAGSVEVNGFTLTNPDATYAVSIGSHTPSYSDIDVLYNMIDEVGDAALGSNVHAVVLHGGADQVTVKDNLFNNIKAGSRSASGVGVLDSQSTDPSEDVVIDGNVFTDIASTTKGAYGVIFNNKAGSPDLQVTVNTFSSLSGAWTHAVGLEGPTAGALVSGNTFSGLTTTPPSSDVACVLLEDNLEGATIDITGNKFNGITFAGVAIHPKHLPGGAGPLVDFILQAECNYWGADDGPGYVAPGSGAYVTTQVDYQPWSNADLSACTGMRPAGVAMQVTGSPAEVGSIVTIDSLVTAEHVQGIQLNVQYDSAALEFQAPPTSTYNDVAEAGWKWDSVPEKFLAVTGGMRLAGAKYNAPAMLAGQSVATWGFKCLQEGTHNLTYDATDNTGTILSDENGYPIAAPLTGATVTCLKTTAPVDGYIKLQGRAGGAVPAERSWQGAQVTLTCVSGACLGVSPYVMTTDPNGYYHWDKAGPGTGVALGTYTVQVVRRAYLGAIKVGNVTVVAGSNTINAAADAPTLLGGDLVPDPVDWWVSINDLGLVSGQYGTTRSPDTGPDINGDGWVNLFDLAIASGNYYKRSVPGTPGTLVQVWP